MEDNKNFDSQLKAYFDKIKHSIKEQHVQYLKSHPQLRQILNDFLSSCLLQQTDNVYDYAKKFFSYFNYHKDIVRHKPLIISGCSGVAKETLINLLLDKNPNLFELSISYTTRRPRQGQVHGREYYFVNKDEFERVRLSQMSKVRKMYSRNIVKFMGIIMEHIRKNNGYHESWKSTFLQNQICILDIDVQGAQKIYKNDIVCNYLFIDAPNFEALQQRLKKRGTETAEVIEKRLNNAKKEIQKGIQLTFYKHFTNDNLTTCYENFASFIDQNYKISIKK